MIGTHYSWLCRFAVCARKRSNMHTILMFCRRSGNFCVVKSEVCVLLFHMKIFSCPSIPTKFFKGNAVIVIWMPSNTKQKWTTFYKSQFRDHFQQPRITDEPWGSSESVLPICEGSEWNMNCSSRHLVLRWKTTWETEVSPGHMTISQQLEVG